MPTKVFSYKPLQVNSYNSWGRLTLGIYENNNSRKREERFKTAYLYRGWEFSEKRQREIQLALVTKQKSARERLYEYVNKVSESLACECLLTKICDNLLKQ